MRHQDYEPPCRYVHSDIFFPPPDDERTGRESLYFNVAKLVCEHCEMQKTCWNMGMREGHPDGPEPYGVWGGSTPRERRRGVAFPPPVPARRLPENSLDYLPGRDPGNHIDIQEVTVEVKSHLERRGG